MPIQVLAPLPGRVVALESVPDQVFAQEMVGPGIAIEPGGRTEVVEVLAPVSGKLATLYPHAFAIEQDAESQPGQDPGRTVLVHLGIDTVALHGDGFETHAAAGDQVEAGQLLVTWKPEEVAGRGLATVCPVIALQAPAGSVSLAAVPGRHVAAGDPLFTWASPGA